VPPPAPARPAGPDPKLLAGDAKVYLSDMREEVVQGEFTKHGKALDQFFNGAVVLDGRKSPHGLGMFQRENGGGTKVRYALGKNAQRFQALVAFNDFGGAGHLGPITFRVLGDGKVLWESEAVQFRHEPQECSVDVRRMEELELEVQVGGFGNGSPAVWFEPCLLTDPAAARREPPLLPLRTDVRVKGGDVPVPVDAHTPLAGKEERLGDAVVTRLKLPAHDLPGCLCWSADGNSFYYLNAATGTLGQVALAKLEEVRRLEIDRKCSWLSVSAEGLVVTVADRQEVWVVDPETFRVKERLQAPSAARAVSSPALSVAFVPMPPEWSGAPWWQVLDLKAGERVFGRSPGYPPNRERPQLLTPTVTPDGKYLLTRGDHDGRLHRFRVDGPKLVYEESSPAIVSGRDSDLCLSPDGKLVCLPSGGGNQAFFAFNHPPLDPYGTYIYPVTNLQRPEFTIQQRVYPHIIAFDPAGKLIYAQQSTSRVGVFRPSGVKIKDLDFGGQTGDARQTLVHPRGRKLLMLGDDLLSVEITLP
jgi:hypothetical protein